MFGLFPFMSGRSSDDTLSNLFNGGFFSGVIDQVIRSEFINDLANEENYNIDFKDYGEYYLIKGYLPGLNAKDISIDFAKNRAILTIRKKKVFSQSSNSMITVVQTSGNIVKTFDVEEIDVSNLGASFDEDLLIIKLPKLRIELEENNPKIIDVDNFKVE